MAKTIKFQTLEKRYEKFHDVLTLTSDCAGAIAHQACILMDSHPGDERTPSTQDMVNQIDVWCEQFAVIGSAVADAEGKYLDKLSGDSVELIAPVPAFSHINLPDGYRVTDLMFRVGYYKVDGDPYEIQGKTFTDEELLANIQQFYEWMAAAYLKGLSTAQYEGPWEQVGLLLHALESTCPEKAIEDCLAEWKQ